MAITAKFAADFSSFYAACIRADVELKTMDAGAAGVEKSLTRMANSLSGTKMLQDAHLMTEAVDRIGGASALTRAEQEKVNRTLTEAIAKYEALGRTAPAEMQLLAAQTRKVDDETKKVTASATNWKSALMSAAGALGIGFSIGAVVAFGKSVFDAASDIGDMSQRLGISTNAVQGFKFAAEQSGSTLEAVGTAINKMNSNLAGGSKSTVQALTDAELRFADIRALKPEDAFLAITDAIQKIPDPMVQSRVALELFGKSAAELLPAIKENIRRVSDEASKMGPDTIKSLKAAQDAWKELSTKVTIYTGEIIANILKNRKFTAEYERDQREHGTQFANDMADIAARAAEHAGKIYAPFKAPPPGTFKSAEELAAEKAALDKATAALKAHADAIQAIADKYSGAALATKVKDLAEAMRKLPASSNFGALAEDVGKLFQEGAHLTPEMTRLGIAFGTLTPKMITVSEAFRDVHERIDMVVPKLGEMWDALNKPIPYGITHLKDEFAALVVISPADMLKGVTVKAHDAGKALGDLAQAFAQLAQIAGDSLGGTIRNLATLVGSLDITNKSLKSFSQGKQAFRDGDTLAGIAGMASGIMGIASAAIAAGKAIKDMFFGTKGRDAVKDFAETFQVFNLDTMQFNPGGGFNELHQQLGALGAEGERLWIALTQGVGRNNPEQARAVIDLITKALAAQKTALIDTTGAVIAEGDAQVEAARKAQAAVEEMTGKIQSLEQSIANEAPEEVMGIVEANTRAQIAAMVKQRDAAQQAIDDTTKTAAAAAKEAGDIIDEALAARQFRIRVKVDLDGLPGGSSGGGSGGGGAGSAQVGYAPLTVNLDGESFLRTMVRVAQDGGLA